ncbi:Cell division cycle protein 27 [Blattella germanica]|nr:Cell division cycle protein 27 [Blattella germanica]
MIVQEPVQAAIWHCLNHYAYPDAIFLAERLCAEALFLLATCYYRSGKPGQAYSILRNKGTSSPQCKYLLAKCCLDLQKLSEAESVLTGGDTARSRNLDELVSEFGDQACFALQILGRICSQTERGSKAADAYLQALKLNPFLWHSFEELCNRGEKPDPARTFQVSHLENFAMCHGNNSVVNFVNSCENSTNNNCNNSANTTTTTNEATLLNTISSTPIQLLNCFNTAPPSVRVFTPEENPLVNPLNAGHSGIAPLPSTRGKPLRFRGIFSGNISPMTPSFGVLPLENSSPCDSLQMAYLSPTLVPSATLTEANDQKSLAKRVSSLRAHVGQLISRKETPLQQSKPVFSQSGNTSNTSNIVSTPSPTAPQAPLQPGSVRRSSRLFSNSYSVKENNKSPNRNKFTTPKSPSGKTKSRISKTNRNKTTFSELNERNRNEKEKTETITSTDSKIINNNSGSIQNIMQQALQLQKQSAVTRYFSEVREREPYRCQLMELYSTALWHLQKEVALSTLAQDLVAQDRLSPAAWCATGNCFSLQKEHDSAIKFFQRAVQVCRMYGIGTIYSKQERYLLAELHFKRALNINTQSSVLMCHIGVVQHALQKTEKALQTLNVAIANDPKNPLCKFHRASIYFAAGRHAEALKELEELKEIVPKESLVYYLTGKVHKKLGNTHLALMHFSWATDLDPKGANSQIKEAIDPAMSREDYPSEGSSAPQHESSQEGAEFVSMREESDESL